MGPVDFARKPWINNSFNPVNNSNYSTEDTGLEHRYDDHPGKLDMPFFRTVPLLDNNLALLRHQQRYIDRVLESSLGHDHVLYAMDNETHVRPEWGEYWATYIQRKAAAAGRRVYCTEMWDPPSLADKMHKHTTSRPDLYAFIDISQNNHMDGELHYSRLVTFREAIVASGVPRPLNNVKVYGADGGNFDDTREGIRRFWQNILGGAASTRFHRPPAGLGLSGIARSQLRAARMFVEAFDLFGTEPTRDVFTRDRAAGEAYCLHKPGEVYALYFPDGGAITLKVPGNNEWSVRWLDIATATWLASGTLRSTGGEIDLGVPHGETKEWAAVITRESSRFQ